jgi:hypothetical protein
LLLVEWHWKPLENSTTNKHTLLSLECCGFTYIESRLSIIHCKYNKYLSTDLVGVTVTFVFRAVKVYISSKT